MYKPKLTCWKEKELASDSQGAKIIFLEDAKLPKSYHIQFSEPIERTLAVKVTQFPEIVIRAAHSYKPSLMADYLYDLAQTYSTFYQNVPFLKAPDGIRESRVRLCRIVAKVLHKGLNLLGIETPERI